MEEMFSGIFREGKGLFTANLAPGKRVYGERLLKKGKVEYRLWDPSRSKLAAAIMNGLKTVPIGEGTKVLYLGASTGTTVSHVSDIVRANGIVYAIEFAERVFRNLLDVAAMRPNIAPILGDARKPEQYGWIEQCDVVYCDLADPQETEITIRNAVEFLKAGGHLMLAIKSQSIDVTKPPEQVYREEAEKLRKAGFEIIEEVNLEPYEEKHALIVAMRLATS
ncbi:MAG: fibrillarin-like rRNA/tRNA 2'-O-methyltransferase [Candidatus Aenigmatarchaeota archaeon]